MYLKGYLTKNTGSVSSDNERTITKVLYFYPNAPGENIIDLYSAADFPKVGQRLGTDEQTSGFILNSINVDKIVPDESNTAASGFFTWPVTCNYSDGISKNTAAISSSSSSSVKVDTNGQQITPETKPWNFPLEDVSINYNELTMPFKYAYNQSTGAFDIPVVNGADDLFDATTNRYTVTYSYKYNTQTPIFTGSVWPYKTAVVNFYTFKLFGMDYAPGTLLLKPINSSLKAKWMMKTELVEGKQVTRLIKDCEYYENNLEFVYNPAGWKRNLLNIGTFAKFPNKINTNPASEQIYHMTLSVIPSGLQPGESPSGNVTRFTSWYGNIDDVARAAITYANDTPLSTYTYEAVTEPLPLTSAGILDLSAISGLTPYNVLEFDEFQVIDFTALKLRTSL